MLNDFYRGQAGFGMCVSSVGACQRDIASRLPGRRLAVLNMDGSSYSCRGAVSRCSPHLRFALSRCRAPQDVRRSWDARFLARQCRACADRMLTPVVFS